MKERLMRSEANQEHMRRAIALSLRAIRTNRGLPFGAVIVRDGEVIAEAHNTVTSDNDPTAHAEMNAIRAACAKLGTFRLEGCEIYTSGEPCPMCLAAIYWARLDRIYYANRQEDAHRIGFSDESFYRELSLPPDRRRIPMSRLLGHEALAAFREWDERPDKVIY